MLMALHEHAELHLLGKPMLAQSGKHATPPKEWTQDPKRRKKAGIPKGTRYRTRHQLCLEMLKEHGDQLPHQWIAGDDEMGRPSWFRRRLDKLGEQYLLSVPSNTLIRDLDADPPAYSGRGRHPKRPWLRVDQWAMSLCESDWSVIDVRDGAKGPLIVEAVKCSVVARDDRRQEGHSEVLVVIRYKDRDNQSVVKTDYYLSNASFETRLAEFTRVAKAEHRIEECLGRKERSRPCGLRGSQLEGLATSSDAFADRHLVLSDGSPEGKKNGHRRLRFNKSKKGLPRSFTTNTNAVQSPASSGSASNG